MDNSAKESLVARWHRIRSELDGKGVRLLAVSKYNSDASVQALADAGQIDFAESRPQGLRDRARRFPDLNWHMIGPVQKNKAKYVGRHACMWHSVCDLAVAEAVAGYLDGHALPVLIQVNISGEPQKQGVEPDQLEPFYHELSQIDGLHVIGLMGMAAAGGDSRPAFRMLRDLREKLGNESLRELCMGMSGDWQIAVEEGATMVRLGTGLFGPREL